MSVRIINADVMDGLAQLPDESVHCVVTSPPYWGLRDYGTAEWEGGDLGCDHIESRPFVNPKNTLGPNGHLPATNAANQMHQRQYRGECGRCGAKRIDKQIGLEPAPEAYVTKMVEVFREVRRVLRKDGTCWLNLGDSYNSGGGSVGAGKAVYTGGERIANLRQTIDTLKPKDLVGIPWRVAFALQADGWWLRQDIIWSKPNPMPESVTDRCTKAHEYIFMLTKASRYFYDASAIAEDAIYVGVAGQDANGFKNPLRFKGKLAASAKQGGHGRRHAGINARWDEAKTRGECATTRNKRSVWEVTTQPFPEAHFATFPPALVEPCIKAGCPEGGTVLDPFGGAGTTGLVADRLKRNAILIELNPEYAAMAERRIRGDCPIFSEVTRGYDL